MVWWVRVYNDELKVFLKFATLQAGSTCWTVGAFGNTIYSMSKSTDSCSGFSGLVVEYLVNAISNQFDVHSSIAKHTVHFLGFWKRLECMNGFHGLWAAQFDEKVLNGNISL